MTAFWDHALLQFGEIVQERGRVVEVRRQGSIGAGGHGVDVPEVEW